MWKLVAALALALLLALATRGARGNDGGTFGDGDAVPLFANVIGPYSNPSEIYEYFQLPYCTPPSVHHRHLGLGEIIGGHRDVQLNALYNIRFGRNVEKEVVCGPKEYDAAEIEEFVYAIDHDYYFQMNLDDLPIWGHVGLRENGRYYLYTHLFFHIGFNGMHVVEVNTTGFRTQIVPDETNTLTFSYSVAWQPSIITTQHRFDRYSQGSFFDVDHEVHWLGIINSVVLVMLLSTLLSFLLMRLLNRDYQRYARVEEGDLSDYERANGWKAIADSVFIIPGCPSMLSAIVGNGAQLAALVVAWLLIGAVGGFVPFSRGTVYTAIVIIYVMTSFVNGLASAALYRVLHGDAWARNVLLTMLLLAVPLFAAWSLVNTVAWSYQAASALPFGTVILLLVVWLVGLPGLLAGAAVGRRAATPLAQPIRTRASRVLPVLPLRRRPFVLVLASGFLPFCSIFLEIQYVFYSLWGHVPYTLYGVLLVVFFIALVVTAILSVVMTYVQLAGEDYRWWWRSLLSGGSTMIYVMLYAVYYWWFVSDMSGLLQGAVFFVYTALLCFAMALLLGALGFVVSLLFVRRIYRVARPD